MSRDPVKSRLLETLWGGDPRYYERAREHVRQASAAGGVYDVLREHLPRRGRVLEVGCGEGSNIAALVRPGLEFVGCDLSLLGVRLASAAFREAGAPRFAVADGERLPFPASTFDAVVGISLLEHLPDPERVIEEAIRVTRAEGILLFLSPQYGGPCAASPCRRGGGAGRFLSRLLRAHLPAPPRETLGWERVAPTVLDGEPYDGDRDSVVEPEIRSLRAFLRGRGLRIERSSSGYPWHSWREWGGTATQRLVRAPLERLGRWGLPPYRDFGPLVVVCARKRR